MFAQRNSVGGNVVSEIVNAAIKRGIFDKEIFDKYHVLTSSDIQKRYLEAVSRRKKVEFFFEYLLIEVTQNSENVYINSINVNNNSINADKNPQSKVKKSKQKESKEKERKAVEPLAASPQSVCCRLPAVKRVYGKGGKAQICYWCCKKCKYSYAVSLGIACKYGKEVVIA